MKFGGTSVGNANRIKTVGEIVRLRLGKKPIVVVSTGGEFTELLSRSLMERGLPVFYFPTEAITALDKVVEYQLRTGVKHKTIEPEFIEKAAIKKSNKKKKAVLKKKKR